MGRTVLIFAITACAVIGFLSFLAVHIEAMIYTGSTVPTSFLPIEALRGHGISIGLVVGAGAGAVAHRYLFRKLFIQRWHLVDEAHLGKLYGK